MDSMSAYLQKEKMNVEILGHDDYAIIINSKHNYAKKKSISIKQLKNFTAALYNNDEHTFCYRKIYDYFSPEKTPYYASKQENLLNIILKDESVAAVFPYSTIRKPGIIPGSLTALPVTEFSMPGFNCLIHPEWDMLTPAERIVIEKIRQVCSAFFTPFESDSHGISRELCYSRSRECE
jgi:hypothetical protein